MAVTRGTFDGLMLLLLGEKVVQTELDEKKYSLLREAVLQGVSSQIPVLGPPVQGETGEDGRRRRRIPARQAPLGERGLKVFLDASAIIAYYNADDKFHPEA
jgi:hypothetical protein